MADRSIKVILSAQITDFKRQMDEASKSAKKVGEEVPITVLRDGRRVDLKLRMQE